MKTAASESRVSNLWYEIKALIYILIGTSFDLVLNTNKLINYFLAIKRMSKINKQILSIKALAS